MSNGDVNKIRLFTLCTIIAVSSNWQYGFSSTYLNTPVQQFKAYLNESIIRKGEEMTDYTYSWMWDLIENIWFVGFFLGIWLSPILNDRFGRKPGLIIANSLNVISSILQFLGVYLFEPSILIIGRAIASIATAVAYEANVLYLQECSPTSLRGATSFVSEIAFAAMCVVGMMLGTDEILGNSLNILLAVNIPPCILAVVVIFFIPETPKYLLITRGRRKAAGDSIRFYQGEGQDVAVCLKEMEIESVDESSYITSFTQVPQLFKEKHLRKGLILSVAALQNTIPLWTFIYNSTDFLLDINLSRHLAFSINPNLLLSSIASWASTMLCVLYLIGTIIGSTLVDRFGRRKMLIPCTLIDVLCIILFVVFSLLQPNWSVTNYFALLSLQVYCFVYGLGVGAISWFLSAELSPIKYRSLMQSASYSINTIFVVISTFAILPLYSLIGSYSFLILYTIPSITALAYLIIYLPETKGRETHEIVMDLKSS